MSYTEPAAPCTDDLSCSDYCAVLAIDTSHLCVIARAAAAIAEPSVDDAFRRLLGCHGCNARRRLTTSGPLWDHEINPASPDSKLHQHASDLGAGVADSITVDDRGGGEALAACLGVDHELDHPLMGRDGSLVAVAEFNCGDDESCMVVTDDEKLLDAVDALLHGNCAATLYRASMTFLTRMAQCGAISPLDLAHAADAEESYATERGLDGDLLKRKRERVRNALNTVALLNDGGSNDE